MLAPGVQPADMWREVAMATHDWLARHRLAVPDAVVLVPFADLLTPARRAFANHSPWMPRVHTQRTLAAALGPPVVRAAGELTGDGTVDRVTARELVRRHARAREWQQRDPHGFDAALQRLVHTAHAVRRHADAMTPDERAAWFTRARKHAGAGDGPGSTHRLLLRLAIEWAGLAGDADTDRLFAHRPSAWVALTLGGEDPLTRQLLRHGDAIGVPVLSLSADPSTTATSGPGSVRRRGIAHGLAGLLMLLLAILGLWKDVAWLAQPFYAWASEKDPKYPDAAFALAKQAVNLGEIEEAKTYLRQVHERKGKKLLNQLAYDPMWEIVKDDPEVKGWYDGG